MQLPNIRLQLQSLNVTSSSNESQLGGEGPVRYARAEAGWMLVKVETDR
jgi:hypothetical protein